MKKIFLISLFLFIYSSIFAQETSKKIYFLADTINTTKKNQLLNIETVSFFEHIFTFFCKCAPPYKSYVTFSYINKKGAPIAEVVSKKPDYPYVSFKELMDLSGKWHSYFDNKYDLYITEVLPGNKFRTNKVKFMPYSPPIDDGVTLKDKQ